MGVIGLLFGLGLLGTSSFMKSMDVQRNQQEYQRWVREEEYKAEHELSTTLIVAINAAIEKYLKLNKFTFGFDFKKMRKAIKADHPSLLTGHINTVVFIGIARYIFGIFGYTYKPVYYSVFKNHSEFINREDVDYDKYTTPEFYDIESRERFMRDDGENLIIVPEEEAAKYYKTKSDNWDEKWSNTVEQEQYKSISETYGRFIEWMDNGTIAKRSCHLDGLKEWVKDETPYFPVRIVDEFNKTLSYLLTSNFDNPDDYPYGMGFNLNKIYAAIKADHPNLKYTINTVLYIAVARYICNVFGYVYQNTYCPSYKNDWEIIEKENIDFDKYTTPEFYDDEGRKTFLRYDGEDLKVMCRREFEWYSKNKKYDGPYAIVDKSRESFNYRTISNVYNKFTWWFEHDELEKRSCNFQINE